MVAALSPKRLPRRRPKGRGTGSGRAHLVGVAELGHLVRMIERLKRDGKPWHFPIRLAHPSLRSPLPKSPQHPKTHRELVPHHSGPHLLPTDHAGDGFGPALQVGQRLGESRARCWGRTGPPGTPKGSALGPGAEKDGEKVKGTALRLPYLLQRRSLGAAGFELEDGLVGHRGGRTVQAPEPGGGGERAEITPPTPRCQPGVLRCLGWVRPS